MEFLPDRVGLALDIVNKLIDLGRSTGRESVIGGGVIEESRGVEGGLVVLVVFGRWD